MTLILVVEDENTLRTEIADTLQFENYEVLTAQNGRIGLELARKRLPDLIISDIMMPELDGYGLLMALREDPRTAMIPFIFLTARSQYQEVRRGMSFGADDYLSKPFYVEDLLDTVRTRLEKRAGMSRFYEERLETLRMSLVKSLPHELRTPLTGIMGYISILVQDYDRLKPEQALRMLHAMQKAGNRLFRLVQNYLLFAQLSILDMDNERMAIISRSVDFYPTNPSEIVDSVARDIATTHERKDDLHLQISPAFIRILVEDFQKIIEELVDNAFKFSTQGTPVMIQGEVLTDAADPTYRLSISDQGRGMTQAQIKEIGGMVQFERKIYEQQGSGLGLVIAQRLTQLYTGGFTIDSTLNQGTTLHLTFKLASEP